jgi:glycosyltransferase involved in cell wall biosynthesis
LRRLRIGFFVQRVAGPPEFRGNVSAHVQIPCKSIELLRDRGHSVELITTEFTEGQVLPDCVPSNVNVHQVPYGSRQSGSTVMYSGVKKGVSPLRLCRQLHALSKLARNREYDILHLCGGNGIGLIGGLLRRIGMKTPIVATLSTGIFPERFSLLKRCLWRKLDAVITSSDYFAGKLSEAGIDSTVIRHGICREVTEVRSIRQGSDVRRRVLYWRDPDRENGADTCAEVFDYLAPKYADLSFEFAVRPHWDPVKTLESVANKYENVLIRRFPYPNGATIEDFLADSLCVVLPFRRLSINPQFAIMESMSMGIPVITTKIESNGELIESGKDGFLVEPEDTRSIIECVERCISDERLRAEIEVSALDKIESKWNWSDYAEAVERIYAPLV